MKVVTVRYKGKTYRAYQRATNPACHVLLDVDWGWECNEEMVNYGYQREFLNQKQWNVPNYQLVLPKIYLGGE